MIILPQKPGGHVRYDVPSVPPDIIIKNTYWDVDIQFLDPP